MPCISNSVNSEQDKITRMKKCWYSRPLSYAANEKRCFLLAGEGWLPGLCTRDGARQESLRIALAHPGVNWAAELTAAFWGLQFPFPLALAQRVTHLLTTGCYICSLRPGSSHFVFYTSGSRLCFLSSNSPAHYLSIPNYSLVMHLPINSVV